MKPGDGACLLIGMAVGAILWAVLSPIASSPSITPVFSPGGGPEILSLMDSAQSSLDVEMYVFTSHEAVAALERAKARGVAVRVILERNVMENQNQDAYGQLASDGINVRYATAKYALTHAKFVIADGRAVLVGSHNFSGAALYDNREASVIIRDAATVAAFTSVFEKDWRLAS